MDCAHFVWPAEQAQRAGAQIDFSHQSPETTSLVDERHHPSHFMILYIRAIGMYNPIKISDCGSEEL